MKRRILTCLMAVVFLFFLFTGCSGEKQETTPSDSDLTETAKPQSEQTQETGEEAPAAITLKVFTGDFVGAPLEESQLSYQEIGKRLNIKFDFELVSSEVYNEKTNLIISSQDYPDLMHINDWAIVEKYSDDGIFTDLKDLYEQYGQNVINEINDHDPNLINDLKDDKGRMFAISRIDWSMLNTSLFVDIDLLNQIGMDKPTTIDEMYDCMVAMKALGDDICPYGAGIWTESDLQPIYTAFGTTEPLSTSGYGGWITLDGVRHYAMYTLQEETKAALKWINKCYSEELIDQEYYTISDDDAKAKLVDGKVGFSNEWQDGVDIFAKNGGWEMSLEPMLPVEGPFGDTLLDYRYPIVAKFVVPTDSEYAVEIMKMYDYFATEEGKTLMNWGVEGDTFVIDDGQKKYTDKIMKAENDAGTERRLYGLDSIYFPHFMDYDSWSQTVSEGVVNLINDSKYAFKIEYPAISRTAEEAKEMSEIMTDIEMLVDEYVQRFIVGQLDIDEEWDSLISRMEDMGIQRAIEISDAQMERWVNR